MSPSTTQVSVAGKVGLQTNNVKSPSSNSQYSSYSSNHPMAEASSPRHRSSGLQQNILPNAMHTQMLSGAAVFPTGNSQFLSGGSLSSHMGGSQSGYNSISSSYQVAQYGEESPPPESMSPYYQSGSGDMSLQHHQLVGHSMGQQYQMLGIQQPLGGIGGALGPVGHQSLGSYHGHHHHHHSGASRSHSQQDSPMTGVQMQQSPVPSS